MRTTLLTFVSVLTAPFRSRLALQMEILALRHQLTVSGSIVEFPEVNGLHHHYERLAA